MSYVYGGLTLANVGDIVTQTSVSTNMEKLVENSAGATAPTAGATIGPRTGQLWYDTTNTTLKFNIGTPASPVWSSVGDVTLTGTQTLTNKTVQQLILNDGYTEEVFAVTGTTPALSPTNGSIQTWTLTANSTPTPGTWASGQSMTIQIGGTTSTVTWTSLAVTWKTNAGVAPTLNSSGVTVIVLWKVDSTIYGARVGDA